MSRDIRVLIVDDSAVVRQVLTRMLNEASGISVIGAASDPVFAEQRMRQDWPDVVVLDVEMPRMDGITFLKRLMVERPVPVVICSSLTESGSATAMEAMAAGAVSIVNKPKMGLKKFLEDDAGDIVQAVRGAAQARLSNIKPAAEPLAHVAAPRQRDAMVTTTDRVVVIGTSTGGTQALERIFRALPATAPGIAVVQHMPERFTAQFAERLDRLCAMRVKEAQDGDRILPGQVLIAPGGRHLRLVRSGAQYRAEVFDGPLVSRHRPSVDVLFRSTARWAGANATGFLLTGMGDDGARGLKEMREAGALTLVQDEASCVVFGMPKEALAMDAADRIIALDSIPAEIMRALN
ncbi:chemotaxis response regulator protein-glutamate methylesterase [Saccharospirillum sp. HFRX-1]|uniref:protein-glutamate methylesterase/protein-glutamine glutaminase n=1 Tax=unclassified Saccharospirillum TaxID=2633430 RepID=UPI00371AC2E8